MARRRRRNNNRNRQSLVPLAPNQRSTTNNNRRKRRSRRTTRKLNNKMIINPAGLSGCARDYLMVLENPFSGNTACIPSLYNFPTLKQSLRSQGTFQTGTAGAGFVYFNPWYFYNNQNAVNWTDPTYAGLVFANTGTGVNNSFLPSPYAFPTTDTSIEGRLVAAGLRIRNVTPLLARGGTCAAGESQNHADLSGLNITNFMMMDTTERIQTSGEAWQSVVYHPNDPSELEYYGLETNTAPQFMNFILGFLAIAPSVTNATQLYEWEAYSVVEYKGQLAHGLTPSLSDPQGYAKVQNSVADVPSRKPKSGDRTAWASSLLGKILAYGVVGYQAYKSTKNSLAQENAALQLGPRIEQID